MKKQFVSAVIAAMFSITAVNAQGGGNFQRRTPEERLAPVHAKLDSAFKLDAAKMVLVDSIFIQSFRDSDKKMDEIRASGGDRDAMMAARQKATDERDAKLKSVLTEAQMMTWKDEIEPSTRPQRGNRPPGQ